MALGLVFLFTGLDPLMTKPQTSLFSKLCVTVMALGLSAQALAFQGAALGEKKESVMGHDVVEKNGVWFHEDWRFLGFTKENLFFMDSTFKGSVGEAHIVALPIYESKTQEGINPESVLHAVTFDCKAQTVTQNAVTAYGEKWAQGKVVAALPVDATPTKVEPLGENDIPDLKPFAVAMDVVCKK